jgi:1-acyl-sn-glycerol-3-phosphate acyltransferase
MSTESSGPAQRIVDIGSAVICRYGRAVHGFELNDLDRIPTDGPALLVFYHGFMPLDVWIFGSEVHRQTGRTIRFLADRFLFKTPGLRRLVRWAGAVPGNRPDAVRMLQQGNLVGVAPGGVREALAGRDEHYRVLWGERIGFAHVAREAGVPIIPIFTENVEEIYRAPGAGSAPVQALYEQTRLPLVPIVGLGVLPIPVKLRAWVGEPVDHVPGESAEDLRDRARDALQGLIDAHQYTESGRILHALRERVRS